MTEPGVPLSPESVTVPSLLVELPAWPRVFLVNLRDLLYPRSLPRLELRSAPAAFWPDVFVRRGLPWRHFLESAGYHFLILGLLVPFSRFLTPQRPQPAPRATFSHDQVIYYQAAEYLPPLDTRDSQPGKSIKADPEFARQPVISVPAEAENRSQTIVTPPNVKLKRNIPLPNIVAWSNHPELPIAPVPVVKASAITRLNPQLESSVVAPPPEAERNRRRNLPAIQSSVAPPPDIRAATPAFQAPQPAVIEPPPSVDAASPRAVGDLNIALSSVVAPAPQLSVPAQRAVPGAAAGQTMLPPPVVPPPPSLTGSGSSSAGGRLIALNLNPSVTAPPDPPQGNRRGTFAATPEGKAGASGNPGSSTGNAAEANTAGGTNGHASGSGSATAKALAKNGLPSGLYVGSADSAATSHIAGDPPPRNAAPSANPISTASLPAPQPASTSARPASAGNAADLSEPEQEVFANRKFYSMTLNMPNLNSAGGTWVIRFSELKKDSSSGELSAPFVIRKVDPGYPLQIMRENVSGTVILYAVIHADGTVGNIRILRSVDDRLDRFAAQAVSQWRFQPANKDGTPVDVEATFKIPFRPAKNF
jgi:TonB family protein